MHPSDSAKAAIGDIAGAVLLWFSIGAVNALTFEDDVIACFSCLLLIFAGNMALALAARHSVNRTAGKSSRLRATAAIVLVLCSLLVLYVDFDAAFSIIGYLEEELADDIAMMLMACVWIAAFVTVWRPFLVRRENGFISACVSLALGGISMGLFFFSLIAQGVLGASDQQVQFIRFALSCVSLATAVSAFMNQWQARDRKRRLQRLEEEGAESVEVRAFDPREDLVSAERFATVGMHLDRYTRNGLESWAYGRNCMCGAIAGSTHFYGAYEGNRLVGFLLADMHGQRRPYGHSWFSACHRLLGAFIGMVDADAAYDAANRRLRAALDPAPDAELVFFAADPELVGKGIGTRLLQAFEGDFAGRRVFLYADDACTYQFYEHRGFTRAGLEHIEGEAPGGHVSMDCMVYVKQL